MGEQETWEGSICIQFQTQKLGQGAKMLRYTLGLVQAISLGLLSNVAVFKKEHWAICKNNQRAVERLAFYPNTLSQSPTIPFAPITVDRRETKWVEEKWSVLEKCGSSQSIRR